MSETFCFFPLDYFLRMIYRSQPSVTAASSVFLSPDSGNSMHWGPSCPHPSAALRSLLASHSTPWFWHRPIRRAVARMIGIFCLLVVADEAVAAVVGGIFVGVFPGFWGLGGSVLVLNTDPTTTAKYYPWRTGSDPWTTSLITSW